MTFENTLSSCGGEAAASAKQKNLAIEIVLLTPGAFSSLKTGAGEPNTARPKGVGADKHVQWRCAYCRARIHADRACCALFSVRQDRYACSPCAPCPSMMEGGLFLCIVYLGDKNMKKSIGQRQRCVNKNVCVIGSGVLIPILPSECCHSEWRSGYSS